MQDERGARLRDPWLWSAFIVMLGVRAVALTRAPDIDELFTSWILERPIPEMMATLRLDSGPPLFYLLLLPFRGLSPIVAARAISMLASVGLFVLAVRSVDDREGWRLAGFLVALHPLSVFFSTRGRAYALVALLVLFTSICLSRWGETGSRSMLALGSVTLLVAAYTHYYAIYLFPLPLIVALTRGRDAIRDGIAAVVAIAIGFIPGFLLLRVQPDSALSWMQIESDLQRVLNVVASFGRLGLDGRQQTPVDLLTLLVHVVGPLLILVAALGARRSMGAVRYLSVILVAIGSATAAAALGFSAYFPLRFESILVGPVVVFFVLAIREFHSNVRRTLAVITVAVGAIATGSMIADSSEPWSPERHVARALRQNVPPHVPIFTSGPVFFELRAQRDESWTPEVRVFPMDREVHPGHLGTAEMIEDDLARLKELDRRFVWTGPSSSPEARALREQMNAVVVADEYGMSTLLVDPHR